MKDRGGRYVARGSGLVWRGLNEISVKWNYRYRNFDRRRKHNYWSKYISILSQEGSSGSSGSGGPQSYQISHSIVIVCAIGSIPTRVAESWSYDSVSLGII